MAPHIQNCEQFGNNHKEVKKNTKFLKVFRVAPIIILNFLKYKDTVEALTGQASEILKSRNVSQ